jgi:hypothetical protein
MMGMQSLGIVVLADEAYYIPRCDLRNRPGWSNLVPLVKPGIRLDSKENRFDL